METTDNAQFYGMEQEQQPSKPTFLKVLCILSFIWEILVIIVFILVLCMSGFIFEALNNLVNGESTIQLDEMQMQGINQLLDMGEGKFAMLIGGSILVYAISLFSVAMMWRMRKFGFYIYAVVNGALAVFSIVGGSYFSALLGLAFVVMYGLNLKHMK